MSESNNNYQIETLRDEDGLVVSRVRGGNGFSSCHWFPWPRMDWQSPNLGQLQHAYTLRDELDPSWATRLWSSYNTREGRRSGCMTQVGRCWKVCLANQWK